jgi:2-dehydropantoate 2-reductase
LGADGSALEPIAAAFRACGIETAVAADINKQIWAKLFLNASASALTAVLQVKLGYIAENSHAWLLATRLIREAVAVANANRLDFDPDQVTADIRKILINAREGITSICADIRDGRRTEVDTISGSVVRKAKQLGLRVPTHEFVVECIHAMEQRTRNA